MESTHCLSKLSTACRCSQARRASRTIYADDDPSTTAMNLRQLRSGDESLLEAFLVSHLDSSMFLCANARRGGLAYRGEPYPAIYAAALRDGRIIGVAAHCWNGMVLIQAPEQAAELASA